MLQSGRRRTKSESQYNDSMTAPANPPAPRSWLPRSWLPRFSLRQLLLAMAIVGVACYALRWASPWWSIVLFYADLLCVTAGLLIAINWPGEPRSFWLGFAVCGILHWLLAFGAGFANGIPPHHPGAFVTTWLSAYCYQSIRPQLEVKPLPVSPLQIGAIRGRWGGAMLEVSVAGGAREHVPTFKAGEDGYFRGFGPGPFYVFEEDFVNVALGFWTLLAGYIGGQVSLVLYRWRTRSAAGTASGVAAEV
jgi:hypothetical protein